MDLTTIPERIELKIKVTESCWYWIAGKDKRGYGIMSKASYGEYYPHIYLYKKFIGRYKGELDHLCRNPSCVNPYHLEPVSHKVNVSRGLAGKWQRSKWSSPNRKCPKGHPMSGANLYVHYSEKHKRYNSQCRLCRRNTKRLARAKGATY